MRKFQIVSALLLLCGAAAVSAQTSNAPTPSDGPVYLPGGMETTLMSMDTNGDKKVSKDEFMRYYETQFETYQKTQDGMIDLARKTQ